MGSGCFAYPDPISAADNTSLVSLPSHMGFFHSILAMRMCCNKPLYFPPFPANRAVIRLSEYEPVMILDSARQATIPMCWHMALIQIVFHLTFFGAIPAILFQLLFNSSPSRQFLFQVCGPAFRWGWFRSFGQDFDSAGFQVSTQLLGGFLGGQLASSLSSSRSPMSISLGMQPKRSRMLDSATSERVGKSLLIIPSTPY